MKVLNKYYKGILYNYIKYYIICYSFTIDTVLMLFKGHLFLHAASKDNAILWSVI